MQDVVPYCGPAPAPDELASRWNLDPPLLAVLVLVAAAYTLEFVRRPNRRVEEATAFSAAWVMLVLLFVSPLCAWSSSLFSIRVAHHVALATLVAPLLVLARPAVHGGSWAPVFALHAGTLWLWHVPSVYEAALANDALFWAMQLSILATAVLLWRRVLAPADMAGAGRAVAGCLGTIVQMGFLGALITFAGRPLYAPHTDTTAPWGLTALEDQQVAGLIMWVPAMLPYLAAALWLVGSVLRRAGSPTMGERS